MNTIKTRTPLTIEKAAEYSGFSKSYLRKMISMGVIPYYKPNSTRQGKIIICKEELDGYLFANRHASNAELDCTAETLVNNAGGEA